jgi:AcrR family transcriptional regulator
MTFVMAPGLHPAPSPRERIIHSAAELIRTKGVSATGLREVVEHAEAPRGSLQHYFPDGKEQLVSEAIAWSGRVVARRVRRLADELDPATPCALFGAMTGRWRTLFLTDGFAAGCPLVAAAADVAASSETVRGTLSDAFDGWQQPLAAALVDMGVPVERSDSLALLMISSLEGAIVVARARRDVAPLDVVTAELGPVLDAAVRGRRRRAAATSTP